MRSFARWILPLLALAGCEVVAFGDRDRIPDGGSGGSVTTTATGGGPGGAATSSGAGGAACLHALDCPGQDGECRVRDCVGGWCVIRDLDEGTPTAFQVPSDCTARVCDGKGGVALVDDDGDVLDDHNACTTDTCFLGAVKNSPYVSGACGPTQGGVCDGKGSCVACVTGAQCAGGAVCLDNHCVPASCTNLVRDGNETAIDCGGPACAPCDTGKPCLRDRDCASGVCSALTKLCEAPRCDDGVRNGSEADTDCGGACVMRCGPGARCVFDEDCAGGLCSGAVCLPSCHDGAQNGAETGLDCGGHACAPCTNGGGCRGASDCQSGVCQITPGHDAGLCVPAGCVDGAKSGPESDVDCGGPCAPCGPGKGCAAGADCTSGVCAGTICAKASCADLVRNGAETGLDCGGLSCSKCPTGEGCATNADCASDVCAAGSCAAPSCGDGVKDQDETDTDCGGSCAGCAPGRTCAKDTDCASLLCVNEVCAPSACDDGLHNGDETDVDCGGPDCGPCTIGGGCLIAPDCDTIACDMGTCVPPSCTDLVRNGSETGVDCGGPTCSRCPGGQGCASGADCASGLCNGGICAASCKDGLKDGDETGLDCGGSCDGCGPGLPCNTDADCASKVCMDGVCNAALCDDQVRNGSESDIDCGGSSCPPCGLGFICNKNSDCASLGCRNGLCEPVLLFSQVRTSGLHGDRFGDDFIEFYNPGNAPVTLDAGWELWHKSAQSACQGKVQRYQGKGQLIPAHHHFLLVGLDYVGPPGDDVFMFVDATQSIADTASLYLLHNGEVVDAVCYYYDATTLGRLTGGCMFPYICEGMPVSNLPHKGLNDDTSALDVAIERRPGGAAGNAQDTDDSASDFITIMPANPRSLSSPPTP